MNTKVKEELQNYKISQGTLQKVYCNAEEQKEFILRIKNEQPLPDEVFKDAEYYENNVPSVRFYRLEPINMSSDEVSEYLVYKQLDLLQSIKSYLKFIYTITIISLIFAFVYAFVMNFVIGKGL